MLRRTTLVSTALAVVLAQNAAAVGMDNVKVHGFVNAVGSVSDTRTKYLKSIDSDGDWTSTDYGLNIMAIIDPKLTIATQFHGTSEKVVFDWGFGRYQFNDSFAAKGGRMKYTGNLISEYIDVGYAYPWVRPPEVIYSENADLFFESYNGASTVFTMGEDETEYSAEIYTGAEIEDEGISHKKMVGVTLKAVNEDYGEIRLAYNHSTLLTAPTLSDQSQNGKNKTYVTLGAKGYWNQFELIAEYAQSRVDDIPAHDAYGAFATLGYKIGRTMPHITYQKFDKKTGANQSGWTLGVRHFVGSSISLKFDVQRVTPKGGGLFASQPSDSSVNIVNAAASFIF